MSLFDILDEAPGAGRKPKADAHSGHHLAASSIGGVSGGPGSVPSSYTGGIDPDRLPFSSSLPSHTHGPVLEKFEDSFAPTADGRAQSSSDSGIFSLETVDLETGGTLSAIAVSNNVLILALEHPTRVIRIHLDAAHHMEDIELELPKKLVNPLVISKILVDPFARHVLLVSNEGIFYLGSESRRARHLNKLKGIIPTCVAWNKDSHPHSVTTGSFLLGSMEGGIYELILEHVEDETKSFFSRKGGGDPLKFIKQVGHLSEPPLSMYLDSFTVDVNKYILFVCTASRLMQFIGQLRTNEPGSMEQLFTYPGQRPPWTSRLTKDSDMLNAFLSVQFPVYSGSRLGTATSLTLLNCGGLYNGPIVMGSQISGDSVLDRPKLYSISAAGTAAALGGHPRGLVTLRFHYLVFGERSIGAYSSLTDDGDVEGEADSPTSSASGRQVILDRVWEKPLVDDILDVSHDTIKGTIWVITRSQLYELVVKDEDRDIWKFYLARHKFEIATAHARSQEERDIIAKAQADHYFESKRYVLSAKSYAQASLVPFEQVALQFIEKNELEALRVYLGLLLELKVKSSKDNVQSTILATWLLELNLQNLNEVRQSEEEQKIMEADVRRFIEKYFGHLDAKTVKQLCTSYNRLDELLHFYQVSGDYANVIEFWISQEKWDMAYTVLERQVDPKMYYRFVPPILPHLPTRVIRLLISQGKALDPTRFISAFIKSNSPQVQTQIIKYLEHCIGQNNVPNPVIHNLLVQLFAIYDSDESRLLQFLKVSPRHYALDHAIRVCHQYKRIEACIYLFTELEMVSESIRLSLQQGDVDYAMELAGDTAEDDLMRTNWISIMKYLIEKKEYSRAMSLVRTSKFLKLEDVLLLFPDFCDMDTFKTELVEVLEDYSKELKRLESDMEAGYRSLQDLRRRKEQSTRVTFSPNDRCPVCRQPLVAPISQRPVTTASTSEGIGYSPSSQLAALRNRTGSVLSGRSSGRLGAHAGGPVGPGVNGGLAGDGTGDMQNAHGAPLSHGGGLYAFPCHHVVHARCARTSARELAQDDRHSAHGHHAFDCPVCGDVLISQLEMPFHDPQDTSWSIS